MSVKSAFADYQQVVNADKAEVREARRRRDLFRMAFLSESDVPEVIASGSLARGTEHKPIHDVDAILIFDEKAQPGWGKPGQSAGDALAYVGSRVNALLGATSGTVAQEVRLASPRDHAVKCFLDDPDAEQPFTVDVMPAFRRDGMLLIPEVRSRQWIPANPEYLIALTKAAHSEWNSFAPLVRVLKAWRHGVPAKVTSLLMEVLALQCLPREGERAQALSRFFTSAAFYVQQYEVCDPADVCGAIQPDLDTVTLASHLSEAGRLAADACAAEAQEDHATAIGIWRQVFGTDFPEAPGGGGGSGKSPNGGASDSGSGAGVEGPGLIVAPTLLRPRPVRDAPQG